MASISPGAISTPKGVFTSIADGRERNGIRMPAWREVLSDEEIWQATAYVLSISQIKPVARRCRHDRSSLERRPVRDPYRRSAGQPL